MSKNIIIAIVAVIVLIGAGAGAYMLTKKDTGKQSDDTSKTANDTSEAANKYSDACKMFTPEAIANALGGTFMSGETDISVSSSDGLEGSACRFKQHDDGTTAGMTQALDLAVTIDNYKTTSSADQFMKDLHDPQTAEGQAAVSTPTDVDGVGDQAFFPKLNMATSISEKTETLYVRSGKQVIVLTATRLAGIDRDVIRAGLTALGKEL